MGSESQLEKFVVDFVWQKTMHRVSLHLGDQIAIRPLYAPQTGRHSQCSRIRIFRFYQISKKT